MRKLMLTESGVGADQGSAKGRVAPRVNDVYEMVGVEYCTHEIMR